MFLAQVYRKPDTTKRWFIDGEAEVSSRADTSSVDIEFSMGASGGVSNIRVKLNSTDFKTLAIDMIAADRETAIKAFGAALQWEPLSVRLRKKRRNAA